MSVSQFAKSFESRGVTPNIRDYERRVIELEEQSARLADMLRNESAVAKAANEYALEIALIAMSISIMTKSKPKEGFVQNDNVKGVPRFVAYLESVLARLETPDATKTEPVCEETQTGQ